MNFCQFDFSTTSLKTLSYSMPHRWQRSLLAFLLMLVAGVSSFLSLGMPPALAGLQDDRFDGNIFTLYAGNGSLVPPKVTLADSLKGDKPTLLVLYTDDSSDCKQFSTIVSQLQAYYGRVADFLPISVDSIPQKATYTASDPGYYYKGFIPQTVLFNQTGQVVFDASGNIPFEAIDDAFRKIFDLLPRSESSALRRRVVNEVTTELSR
jgi:hypothetical protein